MIEYFKNIFEYENWSNKEITESLIKITVPPEKALSIMSHIINAQILWLSRIKNTKPETGVWQDYSKSELPKILSASTDTLTDYIDKLNENELQRIIEYQNTKGEQFKSKVEDILIHLTHHSAYHRGQVVSLIKDKIANLPYTDYIHYVRSIKS